MIALALLLAVPVLEPDAGGLDRLQPRHVQASSFLANGWNAFEQNYLPLYATDDDPATAWVEGASGPGVGESITWLGPTLRKARALRLFVRAGYQKSKSLHEANARPRKIRVQPVRTGEVTSEEVGAALEVELADALGWQRVDVPVPALVTGVRLTVLSVYPGTKYEDTCLSDLRVYVDAEDPYRPELEAAAAEAIRAFVQERKQAAKAGAGKAVVRFAPAYDPAPVAVREEVGDFDWKKPAAAQLAKVFDPALPELKAATEALAQLEAQPPLADGKLPKGTPTGARGVRLAQLPGAPKSAAVAFDALYEVDDEWRRLAPLFAQKSHAAFEESQPPGLRVRRAYDAWLKVAEKPGPACVRACQAFKTAYPHTESFINVCACKDLCLPAAKREGDFPDGCDEAPYYRAEVAAFEGSGLFVFGAPARYERLLSRAVYLTGGRESIQRARQDLFVYSNDLALSVASRWGQSSEGGPGERVVVHVLRWDRAQKPPLLQGGTSFSVQRLGNEPPTTRAAVHRWEARGK